MYSFSHGSSNQWHVHWCVRVQFRVRLPPLFKRTSILVSPPYEIVTLSVRNNISICGMLIMHIFDQHFNGLCNVTCNFCMLKYLKIVIFIYKFNGNEYRRTYRRTLLDQGVHEIKLFTFVKK